MIMEQLKNAVARKVKLAYIRGLVYGVGGNISVKSNGTVFITPEGASLREVSNDDIVTTDLAGKTTNEVKPSIELPMHIAIFHKHPKIQAIVHTHSPFATARSTTGKALRSK